MEIFLDDIADLKTALIAANAANPDKHTLTVRPYDSPRAILVTMISSPPGKTRPHYYIGQLLIDGIPVSGSMVRAPNHTTDEPPVIRDYSDLSVDMYTAKIDNLLHLYDAYRPDPKIPAVAGRALTPKAILQIPGDGNLKRINYDAIYYRMFADEHIRIINYDTNHQP